MKRIGLALLLSLIAAPLTGQVVDTVRGDVGRDVLVPITLTASDTTCKRVVKISATGAFEERNVVCARIPVPPPIQPPPTTSTTAWFSDWRTGQILDGGKWTDRSGASDTIIRKTQVVPATGLGFPAGMQNVLRVNWYFATATDYQSNMLQTHGKWTAPAVGGTIYYRAYYRSDLTAATNIGGSSPHPLENPHAGLPGPIVWEFLTKESANQFIFYSDQPAPYFNWWVRLNLHTTYRVEWAFKRIATDTAQVVDIRIFDEAVSATVPAFTAANFQGGYGSDNLASYKPKIHLYPGNPEQAFTAIGLGNNGPPYTGQTLGQNNFTFWGGVATSLAGWIGPYSPTGG